MTGQRPTTITLRTGHVLSAVPGGLTWTSDPVVPAFNDRPRQRLREIVDGIAMLPGTAQTYGVPANEGSFPIVYAIIGEIRAQHGDAFAWTLEDTGDRSILVTDELDDYCCEGRLWVRGGGLQTLVTLTVGDQPWQTRAEPSADEHARGLATVRGLIAAHNRLIGLPAVTGITPLPALRAEVAEDHIIIADPAEAMFTIKGPRGLGDREHGLAAYLVQLAA